jgi:hypothetical protein
VPPGKLLSGTDLRRGGGFRIAAAHRAAVCPARNADLDDTLRKSLSRRLIRIRPPQERAVIQDAGVLRAVPGRRLLEGGEEAGAGVARRSAVRPSAGYGAGRSSPVRRG